jgi:hypothetical protein
MNEGSNGVRVPTRQPDPWEVLADANLDGNGQAARSAWRRIRARWLLPLDAILLALQAERELSAATMSQLGEYAQDGAR